MTDADHLELVRALLELEGFVVLCGYDTDIYNSGLAGWERHTTEARISGYRGTAIRVECVWINPRCAAALRAEDGVLFQEAA